MASAWPKPIDRDLFARNDHSWLLRQLSQTNLHYDNYYDSLVTVSQVGAHDGAAGNNFQPIRAVIWHAENSYFRFDY